MDYLSFSFLLKKTVTTFLLPPGIFLLLLAAAIFLVTKRFRFFLLGLFLLIYVLSIEPTKDFFILPLENRYPVPSWNDMRHVDAIVVLGGGANENAPGIDGKGALSGEGLQRLLAAYRIHNALNKPMIISGGALPGKKPESEISRQVLARLGAKQQFILTETKSRDTNENALFTREICHSHNWHKIVLVTSAYHMRRSMMLFDRFFKEIVPCPTDYKTLRKDHYDYWSFLPDSENLGETGAAVKEYLGITYYRLTMK